MSIPSPADSQENSTRKRSARDIAYDFIADLILRGEFTSGQFLDETDLATSIGVSRTPVREALHRLRADQFIDLQPRRGAQVRSITAVDMQEIYETRTVLETASFSRLCRSSKKIPPIAEEILNQMSIAGDTHDWISFGKLDQKFHSVLVNSAGNFTLHHLYQGLRSQHIRIAIRAIREYPERRSIIEAEHRQILEALQNHDEESALTILKEHLKNVPEVVQSLDG